MAIHFQKMGKGAPLILVHGLFGTSDNLRQVAKALAENFTVYLIDAPAHGQSETISPLTYANIANQVLAFSQAQGLEQFSILGHSMGGKIAMEVALAAPKAVNKLIVADIAPIRYPRRHDTIIDALLAVPLENLSNRQQASDVLAERIPEAGIRGFLLKSLAKDSEQNWYWKFDLHNIVDNYDNLIDGNTSGTFTNPTLFIVGGASDYVSMEHRPAISERFSQVQAKTIQGAGHWLHAEKPVAFCKICRDFLLD